MVGDDGRARAWWVRGGLGSLSILNRRLRRVSWLFFAFAAIFVAYLMMPASRQVWEAFPPMAYFQFPTRFLGPAALAFAVVATVAVLAAAVLPRQIALALLGGLAIGAATPFLTAVAVRPAGAPVQLNPAGGLGPPGAVPGPAARRRRRARPGGEAGAGPGRSERVVPGSVPGRPRPVAVADAAGRSCAPPTRSVPALDARPDRNNGADRGVPARHRAAGVIDAQSQ